MVETKGVLNSLPELVQARVRADSEKVFLHYTKDGRAFSYREFETKIQQALGMLVRLGIGRGDRVAVLLPNSPEFLFFYFAAMGLGAVVCPINTHWKSEEIRQILDHCGAKVCVSSKELAQRIVPIQTSLSELKHLLIVGGEDPNVANEDNPPAFPATQPFDEAVMIYTSGTTGRPKGAILTHRNILTNAREIATWLGLTNQDRFYCVMPLFHVNGLVVSLATALWVGGTLVLAERFSAHEFWGAVEKYGPTTFGSVATMLSNLVHLAETGGDSGARPVSLKFGLCGSAPVPVELMEKFEKTFGCPIVEGYGLTECTCRATFNPVAEGRRLGSAGVSIGSQIRIVDDQDCEVPRGSVGEIVVRGESVMKGYYKDPGATAAALRGGWLHTGDLGYMDGQGYLYIVDRKSDMIIRGGENIYPREVDQVLYSHPNVRHAATIGVPDQKYGEEVKSFVVLNEGSITSEGELLNFCRSRLADYKCPKTIEFLDEIPTSATGKLLKRELRAREKTISP